MKNLDKAILLNYIQIGLFAILTVLSATSLLISLHANADCGKTYVKAGVGYKMDGARYDLQYRDDPYFLRFEAAVECKNFVFGIDYGKQVYTAKSEYFRDNNGYKSAFFIDYKYEWSL